MTRRINSLKWRAHYNVFAVAICCAMLTSCQPIGSSTETADQTRRVESLYDGTIIDGSQLSTPEVLSLDEGAWWKKTEVADMATLDAVSTRAPLVTRQATTGTLAQFLWRPAGDGRIIEQVNPWWMRRFMSSNAWVVELSDKFLVVFVGMQYLENWDTEMRIIVAPHSLENGAPMAEAEVYYSPIQDSTVAIVDADRQTLLLHAATGESVWFDPETGTFSAPDPSIQSRRQNDFGEIVEGADQVNDVPVGMRVFNVGAGQFNGTHYQILAGQMPPANDDGRRYAKGYGVIDIREVDSVTGSIESRRFVEVGEARGALRIFLVVGEKVVFVDSLGQPFVYDLELQQFVSTQEMALPTMPFLVRTP